MEKLLAALTTLGLVHPAEAAPEPGRETPPPVRLEAEALETAPQAEAEPKPEPEEGAQTRRRRGNRAGAGRSSRAGRTTAGGAENESAPSRGEEPPRHGGRGEEMPSRSRAADRAGHAEPRVPADVMPERPELLVPTEAQGEDFEPEFPARLGRRDSSRCGEAGSGALLGGLLAVLVVAVAVLVIVRSRRASPERAVATNVQPTAQENPVFPPAETAVPLPTHGTQTVRPSPVVTRLAASRRPLPRRWLPAHRRRRHAS